MLLYQSSPSPPSTSNGTTSVIKSTKSFVPLNNVDNIARPFQGAQLFQDVSPLSLIPSQSFLGSMTDALLPAKKRTKPSNLKKSHHYQVAISSLSSLQKFGGRYQKVSFKIHCSSILVDWLYKKIFASSLFRQPTSSFLSLTYMGYLDTQLQELYISHNAKVNLIHNLMFNCQPFHAIQCIPSIVGSSSNYPNIELMAHDILISVASKLIDEIALEEFSEI